MPLKPHILGNIGLLYAYNSLITNKIQFFVKPYYKPGLGNLILIYKCKSLVWTLIFTSLYSLDLQT